MAKCLKFFTGNNSHGKPIDVAQSISGAWFVRAYTWNGYAVVPSKWVKLESAPIAPNGYTNAYDGSYTEYTPGERAKLIQWGFTTLELLDGYTKARLPK